MARRYPVRALEGLLVRSRKSWRSTLAFAVVNPLLFLAAMGWGVASIVRTPASTLGGLDYGDFVAPGLLAAAAMQIAVGDSTWPVSTALRWEKTYHAMLATPLGPRDIVHGHLLHVAIRLSISATAFAAAALAVGYRPAALGLLAVPVAVLTGMAFAAPVTGWAIGRKDTGQSFALLYRVGVVPLFLFSGTFFPAALLPGPLEAVAWASPLWHGADLARSLASGRVDPVLAAVHVAFLLALVVVGVAYGRREFERVLRR